jgi:hypothetical protein
MSDIDDRGEDKIGLVLVNSMSRPFCDALVRTPRESSELILEMRP